MDGYNDIEQYKEGVEVKTNKVWIDGNVVSHVIYKLIFSIKNVTSTNRFYNYTFTDLLFILSMHGACRDSNQLIYEISSCYGTQASLAFVRLGYSFTDTKFFIDFGSSNPASNFDAYAEVEFTKTTD